VCSTENDLLDVDALGAPTNISALTTVTQDNTGNTFLPRGEGVSHTKLILVMVLLLHLLVRGNSHHKYKEALLQPLNGKKRRVYGCFIFSAINFVPTITIEASSLKLVQKADLETFFQVYGDVANEVLSIL
jgi:hypothetical protein